MLLKFRLLWYLLYTVHSRLFRQVISKSYKTKMTLNQISPNNNFNDNEVRSLKGYEGFIRSNPYSDKISVDRFHHVEFYSGDSTNTYKRFMISLGLELVAKSDYSTGNINHASYVLQSEDLMMLFTAPYSNDNNSVLPTNCLPGFDSEVANDFFFKHGLGVRAIGVAVSNVNKSHEILVENGAETVLSPTSISDQHGQVCISEIKLYGDVVLRLIENISYKGHFLPNFQDLKCNKKIGRYGINRFDHIVGNVWSLRDNMERIKRMTVSLLIKLLVAHIF